MATRLVDEFGARANPPDENYPGGSLKNETNPGLSNDGSPLDERVGNDWQGFMQSALAEADITANGSPDSVTNPQILDAIKSITDDRLNYNGLVYRGVGNISDFAGQQLQESNKTNAYQYPDNSRQFYGADKSQPFPITIPSDPSTDNGWSLVNAVTSDYLWSYSRISFNDVSGAISGIVSQNIKVGTKVTVDDYHGGSSSSNSGVLFFTVVAAGTGTNDGGKYIDVDATRQLEQNLNKNYSIKAWGAKGDGDQTLLATNKTVDGGQVVITEETHDGICRDNALLYIKSVGGGELFIPSGEYRVYAYSPDLDFDISITGEGRDLSIFKSCDSSPVQNGYGVLASYGNTKRHIKLINFTINGNVDVRGIGSVRAYNFAMYGDNLTVFSSNFSSINSPIDCWYSNVNPDSNNGVYAEGLFLDHSGRNTMSLVGAQNHVYVGCTVSGGGTAGSGINPRACLDVEPNDPSKTCRNIKFSSTTFKRAVNQLTISSWGEVDYDNCTFDAGTDNPNSGVVGREQYPWLFNSSNSQVTYDNCKFLKKDNYAGVGKIFNDNGQGEYVNTQIAKFSNCFGEGVGVHGIGFKGSFSDVELTNSLIPFLIDGTGTQEADINNLTLVNVLDGTNFGAGSEASFAIKNRTEGDVYIDGLKVLIKPDKFPPSNFDTSNIVRHRGVSLDASGATDTTWRIRNVHSDGYYRLLPNKLGLPINAGNFRDWGFPNQPPADDTSNTINPGTPSYKDCTMRGDQ
tara:strand:- start:27425 stop:29653 length:2229 start_codon:yes stop_codon:yes gene_type:complete